VPHKPKDKVFYDLTLSGLIVALSFEVLWKRKNINNVIKNHGKKLPLILGKWDFFKETKTVSNVKRRVMEYLSRPPEIVHVSPYHLLIYGLEKKEIKEKESFMRKLINEKFEQCLQEDINRAILFPWIFGMVYDFYVPNVNIPGTKETKGKLKITGDMEKWIGILLLDDELKSYLINELDHLEKYGDFCSKVAKLYKHFINKYPLYFYSKNSKLNSTD